MPVKSNTKYAILSMLNIRPMSAYELVKFANESIGFFWNESYGNIHAHLKKLVANGQIRLLAESSKGRRKKTYLIEKKGKVFLNEWLEEPPADTIIRDELLLKIFSAQTEQIPALTDFLEEELALMEQALKAFTQIQDTLSDLKQDQSRKDFWLLTLEYGEQYAEVRKNWCTIALELLNQTEKE